MLITVQLQLAAQSQQINRKLFFLDENVIEVTLTTDIKRLRTEKKFPTYQTAHIRMRFSDSTIISEEIQVQPRGEFRKANCDIASLRLNFKTPASPKLSPLKKLKMVGGCRPTPADDELLLKEYLTYKIYNLITIMSFRVRLMRVTYKDSKQRAKSYTQHAFLIEDMTDLAERNNCIEVTNRQFLTEETNRQQMTLVNLFQYMIGNTDWAVPTYHNMKLMVPKIDTLAAPYAVPYDFDYCGIVDAAYAIPHEALNISSVKERLYRGFPRTMHELEVAIEVFKERKSSIMYMVNNFSLLREKVRKDMAIYLEDFYKILESKRSVKALFIDNARKQ